MKRCVFAWLALSAALFSASLTGCSDSKAKEIEHKDILVEDVEITPEPGVRSL